MNLKWIRTKGIEKGNGKYYAVGEIDGVIYWLDTPEISELGWCVELFIPSATYDNTKQQKIVQKAFDYCSHSIGWFPTIKIAKSVCQMLEDYIEFKLK